MRRDEQTTFSMQIQVPPSQVWNTITNYTKTLIGNSDVVSVELISRQHQRVNLRQLLQAPYTFAHWIPTLESSY